MNYLLTVLGLIVVWLGLTYNGLIRLRNRGKEALSDMDVQLKRRFDLIPNLVETVKGYAKHEQKVLDDVTNARTSVAGAKGNPIEREQSENMLSSTLKTLFAVAENYPDLKANANFLELQRELSATEDKIQASRRFYNTVVRDLNTAIATFPTNIVAGLFQFKTREFFDIEEGEKAVTKESFDLQK